MQSNEWTGKRSFGNKSLHDVSGTPNPYETAASIIGRTLAPFDDDNLIPSYGFGDGVSSFIGCMPYLTAILVSAMLSLCKL